jgi:hypothetical protein
MPDGIFAYQISHLERFGMENVGMYTYVRIVYAHFGIFYGHLIKFVVIWYIYVLLFGIFYQEKSGNPC